MGELPDDGRCCRGADRLRPVLRPARPIQQCVEAGINGDNPPLVSCASPDGSWHANNIALACTATDAGGLANPLDASFFLFTSVAAGIEDGNASTDSRNVCDVRAFARWRARSSATRSISNRRTSS